MLKNDSRSVSELFAAVTDWSRDKDEVWSDIWLLQERGTQEVLNCAGALCRSADPRARALGADILGQLGIPERTFPEECYTAIAGLLHDDDLDVLYSAICAAGHLHDPRAIPQICGYASHTDRDIRYSVAFALGSFDQPAATETLLQLTEDPDDEVRDWAAFGLVLSEADSPQIRKAFARLLEDPDDGARYEAACGLAFFCDRRAIPHIARMLANNPDDSQLRELAAKLLGVDAASYDLKLATNELLARLQRLEG